MTPGVGYRPTVILPAEIRTAIESHARSTFPEEACGLLAADATGRIRMAYPLTNLRASSHAFTIDPDEHWGALQHATRQGWNLCGAFHSHPRSAPVPSRADVAGALDPGWITVIAGPVDPGPLEIAAYRIDAGRVERIEVISA